MKDTRPTAHKRGYGHHWREQRLTYLAQNPLCAICERQGRITGATVVDHITPHKGNKQLFWDVSNWQSLCKSCHDGFKKLLENGAIFTGIDGWPIEMDAKGVAKNHKV